MCVGAALAVWSSLAAAASTAAVAYWTLDFSAPVLRYEKIAGPLTRLRSVFEKRHGRACVMSDEQDHFLFKCGDIPQVVVPTRESCAMWSGGAAGFGRNALHEA